MADRRTISVVGADDNFEVSTSELDERLGYAGLVGNVYGLTMPSYSRVSAIVGTADDDYAVNVFFEERDEDVWFAPNLVEFVDHAPGTELEVAGVKMVRDDEGAWHDADAGLLRRLLNRFR